jgi:hypothetical protein
MKKIWNADLLAYIQTSPNQAGTFLACFARFRVGIFLLAGKLTQNLHIAGADSTAFRRLSLWLVPHAVIQKVRLLCVILIIHFIARSWLVFQVFLAYVMSGRPFLVQEFLAMGGIHFISRSQASSGVRNVRSFLRSATSSPGPRLIWGIMFNCELDSSFRICIVRKSRSNRSWKLVEVYDCFLC